MSQRRYCVLWIPTTLHHIICPVKNPLDDGIHKIYKFNTEGEVDLNEEIKFIDILASDDSSPRVYMDITLLKEGDIPSGVVHDTYRNPVGNSVPLRHIYIEVKLENGQVFDSLFLQCIDARRNGLFQFSYVVPGKYLTPDTENKYLLNSNFNITNAIYHTIKSFYHVHEFHDAIKDSILHPFSSEYAINLTQPNNEALLHYLDELTKVLVDEHRLIKELKRFVLDRYSRLWKIRNEIDYKQHPVIYRNVVLEIVHYVNFKLSGCVEQCKKALNMHIYFQSLLFSKYNKVCKINYDSNLVYDLNIVFPSYIREEYRVSATPAHAGQRSVLFVPHYCQWGSKRDGIFYKKAINIYNAIGGIKLLQKEMSIFVLNEFLKLNQSYNQLIRAQIDAIRDQTVLINRQTKEIERLTKVTSKSSTRLTLQTCAISILCSIVISWGFYLLSKPAYSPENDIRKVIGIQNDIQKQIEEQWKNQIRIESENRVLKDSLNILNKRMPKNKQKS